MDAGTISSTQPGAGEQPSPRKLMDDLYRSMVWMLVERDGLAPLEAWERTSKTIAFRQLLDTSTGLYLRSPEEIYEIFRSELGL